MPSAAFSTTRLAVVLEAAWDGGPTRQAPVTMMPHSIRINFIPQAQAEQVMQPDRVADDLRRKVVSRIGSGVWRNGARRPPPGRSDHQLAMLDHIDSRVNGRLRDQHGEHRDGHGPLEVVWG
ncbi:MAG TPA: hypothetical protein VNZ61_02525 [Roseomonas sp.]|nr:hypothetical protein [Roseomonas sp.]